MPSSTFSAALSRDESVYRSIGGRPAPVHGCGFVRKPTAAHGYANRLMPHTMVAVYVLRGEGTFTDWNALRHRIRAGDMVLMPAGKRHGIQQDANGQWAEAYLTVDGGFGDALFRLGVLDRTAVVLRPGLDVPLVQQFERILNDLQVLPDYALPSVLVQAHELLATASQLHRKRATPGHHQQMIESACVLLSQELKQRLDMATIASQLGMSYERFRKLFKQRVGLSPGDYRIRRRIDRARALIFQNRLSNKQVAYELGYPDPFTFSKQFRKMAGVWPDDFRRSCGLG